MSKVVAIMSMSLDGYVADLNDGVAEVFDWYLTSGDVEFHTGGSDPMTFKVSGPSAQHLRGLCSELGAVLTGRRTFDVAHGWGGNHAWGPAFVLTHHIPAGWPRPNSTVHFVTDGIESAVNQACVTLPLSAKFLVIGGADTTTYLWSTALPLSLGVQPPSASRIFASPSTSSFVPAAAARWRATLPGAAPVSASSVCATAL